MSSELFALLGADPSAPDLQQAKEDAHLRAELITQLVKRRKHLGLTQKDLAKRLQTSQSVVSDIERIGGNPTMMTLQRYARGVNAELRASVRAKGFVYHSNDGWLELKTYSAPIHRTPTNSLPSWGKEELDRARVG